MNLFERLLPRGMAGRLLVSILAALGLVQVLLIVMLQERKSAQVRDVIEHQALMQTITAVQLARDSPPGDLPRLLAAFSGASACGSLVEALPDLGPEDHGAADFARSLQARLGDAGASPPQVRITRLEGPADHPLCPAAPGKEVHGRPLQVTSYVPMQDGHWLAFTSIVEFPEIDNLPIALMFLVASAAVAAVAIVAVRTQTQTLAALSTAADQLGRGEAVPPLAEAGPLEVANAARAFNTMQSRLKTFMDDRVKMLAAISHDLRTPLTTLRLKAEFVRDKANRQSLIDTIEEMTVITEATLALTRAEAAQEPTRLLDLSHLLESLRDEYAAKGLKVGMGQMTGAQALVREVALKRALRNLIDNALRYGGSAALGLEQHGEDAVISIVDEGPGIAEAEQERVFEPFVRIETSRSKETGGIGLGLAIARGIAKSHGGGITIANRREGGLRAELILPLAH
ncbi:MAG: two-component sensor histidine kinase [Alphaproteobacteria bacterium]|nr:two-component sensor histidine kinase [Alphaproteobacteria bacterium]